MIPAFLSVHVEPDAYQVGPTGPAAWDGYDAVDEILSTLRTSLARAVGGQPSFTWLFRMDPQIQATCSSGAHAVTAFRDRVDRLAQLGDRFGLHIHPLRWSDERNLWVHEFADRTFTRGCIVSAVETFTQAIGEPPRVHSFGAGMFSDDAIETLDELDVWIDMSADRQFASKAGLAHPVDVASGVDTAPIVGSKVDCSRIPPYPYRPSHDNARRVDQRRGRQIVVVPMSAVPRHPDRPKWRRVARRVRYGLGTPMMTMYTARTWPNPRDFWDVLERHLDSMRHPYVAIGVRTDKPGSKADATVRALFEQLPDHPIASRLEFVDPVAGVPPLLPAHARRGLAWA